MSQADQIQFTGLETQKEGLIKKQELIYKHTEVVFLVVDVPFPLAATKNPLQRSYDTRTTMIFYKASSTWGQKG